ncbi:DEAD/DEAH box helicase family protein [Haloarchaeobius sp. FL176]|uniref:DEAD/DEAH box helicase family protein n=1 Tax=Haloarchaeobius sp. FL176 TaxID=2967129 RepID=UPI0021491BF3|nr:DEAD/DEAH box helicase family protein [Haloarchaeobius sp. FL176]
MAETIKRARGRASPYCVGDLPSDKYYVANLSPEFGSADREEFDAKTRPSSISLECKPDSTSSVSVVVEFEFYVPSFPTYTEYQEIQEKRVKAAKLSAADRTETSSDWADIPLEEIDRDILYTFDEPFFRRGFVSLEADLALDDLSGQAESITNRISEALYENVAELGENHRLTTDSVETGEYTAAELADLPESEFQEFNQSESTLSPEELEWDVQFSAELSDDELELTLSNHPPSPGAEEPNDGPGERYIFNPKINVTGELAPYEFDLIPEDYRYDQTMWAKGRNCSTTVEEGSNPRTIKTTAVPTAPVYEFEFNTSYNTDFAELSTGDTIDILREIAAGMSDYHDAWTGPRRTEIAAELGLSEAELAEFDADAEDFITELERFEHGITVLEEVPEALRAFKLMNEVNSRQHDFPGWRLFQLVFIVSNLSAIVRRERSDLETEYDDDADVLWFPTGGGKTEAYIGLIIFNLFYDRLRGKSQGVTAWIRFPLRLLSRQQKSRFLESLLHAEQLRRSDSDRGLEGVGDPFSLGFFAGSNDTPNAIGTDRDTFREMFQESQEQLEARCQVIDVCPLCESDITVEYDVDANSVFHTCTADECLGRLPLYVVDRDIYRYVPSVLLGSLDKIAITGQQPRFANLLGNYTTKCPDHGYGYSGRCSEYQLCDRDDHELESVDPSDVYDPVPTLHLVDEIHLLNEELGTFAAHYETLYQTLCEKIHGEQPKVLASTATISEYERQIEHLFQKGATRFPTDGPTRGETFYGELTETVEREYFGFRPANRSHLYTVVDTIMDYHQLIQDAYDTPAAELADDAGLDELSEDEKAEILDLYETSVVYFTNKRRKDRYRENIAKYAAREMILDGYEHPIRERQLTADTENPELLAQLEEPGDAPFDERIDTVPSTSFIGHGIDVDRFNMMLFFGYPRRTFQYIQASSRVGRQSGVVGFVLDIFDPLRERDDHRYRYFEKLHEYLDRTVEPIPIDRWAKFGIDRTFTGVLQSLLIQYYRPKMHRQYELALNDKDPEPANVQKATHLYELMTNDDYPELTKDTLQSLVERAYRLDNDYYTNPYFYQEVQRKINQVWQYWIEELPSMSYPQYPGGSEPMISLRDIGEQGTITAQYNNQNLVDALTTERE